jgi:hypothetical protein
MWIRTTHELVWIEVEQTKQGLWIPHISKMETTELNKQ